ncbi:tyrosine-type recombinase/integrase [Poseidonibacter ostreae]|uniref:Tyrosine-type recombinase/integrase n=1 Tax=Poseidonibacter ostreae TaxID=2654171 RepID=A0A6L4WZ43_9BACT|nr:tyrosine-type recombinase/integrase [Poseidonibacter ostreae]KAB7891264.1 tyrosine-type recombinase/integrase [Poseidonibacter ostreae]
MILQKENECLSDALIRWSVEYEESLELKDWKDITIENYMVGVRFFISYFEENQNLDNLKLIDLTTKDIQRFFRWRKEEYQKKHGKVIEESTRTNNKKSIQNFFRYMKNENSNDLEFRIDWSDITFKNHRKDIVYFEEESVNKILKHLESKMKKDRTELSYTLSFAFKLALYGGLRASEVCSVRLNHFGKVYTKSNEDKSVKFIPLMIMGKNSTSYTNPIPYDKIKNEYNYFKRLKTQKETIFLSKRGLALTRNHLYNYLVEVANELELGKQGVHIIRRTFANNLIEKGVEIRGVQILMRHTDIKTTTIYTARSKNQMEEAVSKLI